MKTKIKGYHTCEEAADELMVTVQRVRQFTQLGRLKFIQIGGAYLIENKELERFGAIPRRPGPRPKPVY